MSPGWQSSRTLCRSHPAKEINRCEHGWLLRTSQNLCNSSACRLFKGELATEFQVTPCSRQKNKRRTNFVSLRLQLHQLVIWGPSCIPWCSFWLAWNQFHLSHFRSRETRLFKVWLGRESPRKLPNDSCQPWNTCLRWIGAALETSYRCRIGFAKSSPVASLVVEAHFSQQKMTPLKTCLSILFYFRNLW